MYTDKIIFEGLIISLFFKDKYVIHIRVRELSILTVVKCALQQRRKEMIVSLVIYMAIINRGGA